jgi:uncharacterized SAM-binding protein YcdF (DUF218 family)
MFFVLSKVVFFLIQPSTLCVALLLVGAVLSRSERYASAGKRFVVIGTIALLIAGFSPLGNVLIWPLEERFSRPAMADLGDRIDGIIILGGFEEPRMTEARQTLSLNEAADRLTEAVTLARRFPAAKVVFTGGAADLLGRVQPAAEKVRAFLVDAGVSTERIVLEDASRNTRENATMTRDLVKPQPGSRWVLVTSAFHMPRSIAAFRHAGFDVVAWPADYRTAGAGDMLRPFDSLDGGLRRVDTAIKEYIGLVVYRLTGWTSEIWPQAKPRRDAQRWPANAVA